VHLLGEPNRRHRLGLLCGRSTGKAKEAEGEGHSFGKHVAEKRGTIDFSAVLTEMFWSSRERGLRFEIETNKTLFE
jgi:hypothetical protein